MKFIFLRHLPTANNLSDTFIGHLDLDCDHGYIVEHSNEFESIKKRLGKYVAAYCSPLRRAIQSANILMPNSHYFIDNRLIERSLGNWSNVSKSRLREENPEAFYPNGKMNFMYTPQGGETFKALIVRVADFLSDVYKEYNNNDTIVVVTHNGVITAVKCIIMEDFWDTSNISFQAYLEPYVINLTCDKINYIESLAKGEFDL